MPIESADNLEMTKICCRKAAGNHTAKMFAGLKQNDVHSILRSEYAVITPEAVPP